MEPQFLIQLMRTKRGQHYDLHMQIPITDFGWQGPWNCSTLLAWALWFSGDRRMLGTRFYVPPGHHPTFPTGTKKLPHVFCWTTWFYDDLMNFGSEISEFTAERTPGAICVVRDKHNGHKTGHIAVSTGRGLIIEAHTSASDSYPHGVIEARTVVEVNFEKFFLPWSRPVSHRTGFFGRR